jgi:hypothetical protein
MCKEFFKPNWKNVIGFLIVNSLALLILILLKLQVIPPAGWLATFLSYFYLVLSPFGFLTNLFANVLTGWGVTIGSALIVIISMVQNLLEIAWQYALACFVITGYCMIKGRKGVILKPAKHKK